MKGSYGLIPTMDAAILRTLPDAGSLHGGIRPNARQVKAITRDLSASGLTGAVIGARLRVARHHGFVEMVRVTPTNLGAGWQVTQKGRDFIAQVDAGTYEEE